jgi:hypothetical protein
LRVRNKQGASWLCRFSPMKIEATTVDAAKDQKDRKKVIETQSIK